MGVIGIVANPNSGKDIRRLVTHATVIDNQEKINIIRRIIVGVLSMGGHEVYIMPDRYNLGDRAIDGLSSQPGIEQVQVYDFMYNDNQNDTTEFVETMVCEKNAAALVVMGGDGTNRAAAKTIGDVPLIPISTGTNNVYPQMIEGTAAGLAAAAFAAGVLPPEEYPRRGKRLEICVEGERNKQDIALIDAVVSRRTYQGARAIWATSDIADVFVTQCHPYNIGFSALAGCVEIIEPDQDAGLHITPDWGKREYIAAMSAGKMVDFGIGCMSRLSLGQPVELAMQERGIVAVDGEREISFKAGDKLTFTLTRNGPCKVDVRDVVAKAARRGFFKY